MLADGAFKGFCRGGAFSGPMEIKQNARLGPNFESIDLNVSCEISGTTEPILYCNGAFEPSDP